MVSVANLGVPPPCQGSCEHGRFDCVLVFGFWLILCNFFGLLCLISKASDEVGV